jgi:hypothetical protein
MRPTANGNVATVLGLTPGSFNIVESEGRKIKRVEECTFKRGNNPSPPHWDRRMIQPNQIKFRTCSAPPINENAELTRGAL